MATLIKMPTNQALQNRHGLKRMTREELQRGPGNDHPPVPPFVVVGAKTQGVTPGFRMKDLCKKIHGAEVIGIERKW
jgi:hypothetical protein